MNTKFNDKVQHKKLLVIKIGGELFEWPERRSALVDQIGQLRNSGFSVILVHGGGPQIGHWMHSLGLKPTFVDGLRVTTSDAMQVVSGVLLGIINAPLVGLLNSKRIPSVGIHGGDLGLIKVTRHSPDLGLVGKIEMIDTAAIQMYLERKIIPVIAPLGIDSEGALHNINADLAAGHIAGSLKADRLVVITNVKGLYRKFGDENSFIPHTNAQQVQALLQSGELSGGIIPKMQGLLEALNQGAQSAQIVDGRDITTLQSQIVADPPAGTFVTLRLENE